MARPSEGGLRRSTACAAMTSSIAAIRSPRPTISSSRRAPSGAMVIRSSMPSAMLVEASSNETGWASRRASPASAAVATPNSERASSGRTGVGREAERNPELACEQLERPLAGRRQDRRQRDPDEVEGGGEREHVVVRDRDEPPAPRGRASGFCWRRRARWRASRRRGPGVAGRAVHLGEVPKRERVRGFGPRRPPRGSCRRGGRAGARSTSRCRGGPDARDRRVKDAQVGRERLQVERAGDVERVEQRWQSASASVAMAVEKRSS